MTTKSLKCIIQCVKQNCPMENHTNQTTQDSIFRRMTENRHNGALNDHMRNNHINLTIIMNCC